MNLRRDKRRSAPLPTEAELEILNTLWNIGPSTVREVHNALRLKQTGYTTVLKQMQVMAEKGAVRTKRAVSLTRLYEAQFPKEQTQQQLARNLLLRAFDGSAKNLVLGALSSQKVSSSELAEIRSIVDDFEKRSK